MRVLLLISTIVTMLASCASTETTGWQYVGKEKFSPAREKKLFEDHHRYCDRKRKIAQDTVKEYALLADPQGAYEHCMLIKGWQPVTVK